MPSPLALHALEIAQSHRGRGEEGGNNRGPFVDQLRRMAGLSSSSGPWCAVGVNAWFRVSAAQLHLQLPWRTHAGAKETARRIAAVGRRLALPEPGAIICWHRPPWPWSGHIGLCESYDRGLDTAVVWEANKCPVVEPFTYELGLWRRRLYLIAAV